MNRLTFVLPLLALCACRSDRHDDEFEHPRTVATTPAAAHNDGREPRTSLSSDDKKFVEKATIGGMFEVQSSRIAQLKDVPRSTLDFAQMMVDDHGKSNRELDRIAREKGVIPPTKLDDSHREKLDELERLDGPEFDRAYRAAQARAHDDAIDLFERSAKKVDDPELSAFIHRILPTLREHRQHLMENIGSR